MSAALVVAAAITCARGDQIVSETANHTRVRVTGFVDGRLHLLGDDGSTIAVPLVEVSRMLIDSVEQMADFNEAERYLEENELRKAIVRYERAQRVATDFWPTIVEVRLLQTCDRAGKLERAVHHFVAVAADSPAAAAELILTSIPQVRTPLAGRLAQRLTAEVNQASGTEQRAVLEILRFAILSGTQDPEAAKWRRQVAGMSIPPAVATRAVYAVKVAACGELLAAGDFGAVLASVNPAITDAPIWSLPDLLLLKGRALLEGASNKADLLAAGAALMRLPIHFPDDQRAPQGLYWAALLNARIDRPVKATQLLAECLAHARISDDLRRRAQEELSRLQGDSSL